MRDPRRSPRTPARIGNGDDRELAALARALGHPARVAILRLLLDDGRCVCGSIVDRLPLAQATVSQHLKVLREAGLIEGEIDGPRICYCVNRDRLARLREALDALGARTAAPRPRARATEKRP